MRTQRPGYKNKHPITTFALRNMEPSEARKVLGSDIVFQAVANAAGITSNLAQPGKHTLQDNINLAARNLAYLEYTEQVDWGNGPMDWETLCNRIAPVIEMGCTADDLTPKKLLEIYNGP